MSDQKHRLATAKGEITVWVRRDKRLKKSSRWVQQPDGSVLMRVPAGLPRRDIPGLLERIAAQLDQPPRRVRRRTDADLQARAEKINRNFFAGKIEWQSIRWVGNMNTRLGSCTNGGATDGHIRISDKIKAWPDWVVDYIIAHELVHRLHPNHSRAFWNILTQGYPLAGQARGFIQGVGFAKGLDFLGDESE